MLDHSISTLAVKAKSNLADCNIRIHSNLLLPHRPGIRSPCSFIPLHETTPAGFHALSSIRSALLRHPSSSFFILSRSTLSFRSISTAVAAVVTAASRAGFSSNRLSRGSTDRANFVRELVTIEPHGNQKRRTIRLIQARGRLRPRLICRQKSHVAHSLTEQFEGRRFIPLSILFSSFYLSACTTVYM